MPGGLHGTACGVAQRGLQQDEAAGRQPLADDPQVGLGLDGDVEPYRTLGPVRRTADPEAAPPLGVGAGPLRHPGRRVGEDLAEFGPGASRASASYARSALVLPLPLGPASSVSGPSGKAAPRWDANADSRSSVRWGRSERWSPDAGNAEEVSAFRARPCDGTTGSADTTGTEDTENAEGTAISGP